MSASIAVRRRREDAGFSLVEVLVVIIIIGILAGIAIPMYLDQQAKAHDATAQQDVTTLGHAIVTDLDKRPSLPVITWSGQEYLFDGVSTGALSPGTAFGGITGSDASNWCVDVTRPGGKVASTTGYRFSATGGLQEGQC